MAMLTCGLKFVFVLCRINKVSWCVELYPQSLGGTAAVFSYQTCCPAGDACRYVTLCVVVAAATTILCFQHLFQLDRSESVADMSKKSISDTAVSLFTL